MGDEKLGAEVVRVVLAWIANQHLESIEILGLLAFFQAKTQGVDIPTRDTVSQRIVKPSLLSWLIVTSLYKERLAAPTLGEMHSETAPVEFEPDPFFLKYVETFVPPIYLQRATRIDVKYSPGFLTQWKFEWTRLVELSGFKLHRPRLEFWTRRDDDQLLCFDLPLSEAYRSAYLRTVAWAADEQLISLLSALWLSAQTCPIDLGLWQVLPGNAPDSWPKCEQACESIDILPGKLTAELAAMWQRQLGEEWLIAAASGRVAESSNSAYDLEITGVIQTCAGSSVPEIDVIAAKGTKRSIAKDTDDLLVFGGGYGRQGEGDYEERYADWAIWRLAAPANPNPVSPMAVVAISAWRLVTIALSCSGTF